MGSEGWREHLNECKLQTPAHTGAGGKYNGQDIKAILEPENLAKLAARIPDDLERVEPEGKERETRGEIITQYMASLDLLHTMCVAKSVIPYNVWGICLSFRKTFVKVYKLGLGISATPKIHICWSHIPEWYLLPETGLDTLYMSDCSNCESTHGAVKRLEQRSNLEVRRNRASKRELNCLESSIASFNFANDVILTGADTAAEDRVEVAVEAVEAVEEVDQSCSHNVR